MKKSKWHREGCLLLLISMWCIITMAQVSQQSAEVETRLQTENTEAFPGRDEDALPDDPALASEGQQTGVASWYGRKFHGRKTASGERFDRTGLTAAHRTLPLGTRMVVRNPANGREVVVTINDRGPHVPGVMLDLSQRAAQLLGFLSAGRARVELQPIQRR